MQVAKRTQTALIDSCTGCIYCVLQQCNIYVKGKMAG